MSLPTIHIHIHIRSSPAGLLRGTVEVMFRCDIPNPD
jgi:hypothetical protein